MLVNLVPLRFHCFLRQALAVAALCLCSNLAATNAHAQPVLDSLQRLNYDPAQFGALIVVAPRSYLPPTAKLSPSPSIAAIAGATDSRVVSAGGVNVLVGRTMTVLNDKPGKANPFAGMPPGQIFKLLLATLTPAQWQKVGAENGIGPGDLNEDQAALWEAMMPSRFRVQSSTVRPGDTPNSWKYTDSTFTDVKDTGSVRIRISKQTTFQFSKQGTEDYSWGGNPYQAGGGGHTDGEKIHLLMAISPLPNGTIREGMSWGGSQQPNNAFGVQLISEQPRFLKTGAIDFAAPVLNTVISLADFPVRPAPKVPTPGTSPTPPTPQQEEYIRLTRELAQLPTIGQILERVTQATGIEFLADKRVRDLPVYLRGNSARAGDLLMALAWSVAGAFRAIEPAVMSSGRPGEQLDTAPLYVLAEDVPGIGGRVANLGLWGQDADMLRRKMLDGAAEKAARNDPLSYISYAPGDQYALSPAQVSLAEKQWKKTKYAAGPEIKWDDLTPALRKAVQTFADERVANNVNLRTDRVRVSEELVVYIVIPEMGIAVQQNSTFQEIGHQFIQEIAFDPSQAGPRSPTAGEKKPESPLGFVDPKLKGQRRILVARTADAKEAADLVRVAASRGITDLWLVVSLEDPEATTRILTAAVKAAQPFPRLSVGASVRLLKESGVPGEPDRTISGETGEAFRDRMHAHYETSGDHSYGDWWRGAFDGSTGWVVANQGELERRLKRVAAVPGLKGLILRASGGPGWTGLKTGGDGIPSNGGLGYTPGMRRAFLREYGMDPIDIPEWQYALSITRWSIGYFTEDGSGEYEVVDGNLVRRSGEAVPRIAWWEFRKRRNDALLVGLYGLLKKASPDLTLYLDNRISGFTEANTDWFGTWDVAEKLPNSGVFSVESEIRTDARRSSKAIFLHWRLRSSDKDASQPEIFARRLTDVARNNTPPNWDGVVLDVTRLPTPELIRLLTALPLTTQQAQSP